MLITVVYAPLDGPPWTREIERGLHALQSLVGGQIESISGEGWTAYLNEEGKIYGLPVNYAAEAVVRRLGWQRLAGDFLVGPVVFCGPLDEEGYDTSVTEAVLAIAREVGGDV